LVVALLNLLPEEIMEGNVKKGLAICEQLTQVCLNNIMC
jgi:hypothetical protein